MGVKSIFIFFIAFSISLFLYNCGGGGDGTPAPTTTTTIPSTPSFTTSSHTDADGNYTISWGSVTGATSYTLEEDDNSSFSSPTTVYSGSSTSKYITGKSADTYYYHVKATNSAGSSNWSSYITITVYNPNAIASLAVTPSGTVEVLGSLTQQFTCIGTQNDGDPEDLTTSVSWSKTGTGSIANGLYTGIRTGGSATIYASYQGLTSNSVSINNTAASIISIEVTPTSKTVTVGYTSQFTANATYDDSSTEDITTSGDWNSTQPFYGTIDSNGLFTAVDTGQTVITCSKSGITSNNVTVTVTAVQIPDLVWGEGKWGETSWQ